MIFKTLLTAFVLIAASLVFTAPAQAQQSHCLVQVQNTGENKPFVIKSTRCFSSYADVLRSTGAKNVPQSMSPASASGYLALTSIIGTHYDGTGASGQSFSVVGSDCNGGGLPVPFGWNDRISSTTNGCPTISHYENTNYTGSVFNTFGAGTNTNITGYMNNKTSSIKYFN